MGSCAFLHAYAFLLCPLSTAFAPILLLTPLSTAFTQTHRGCGVPVRCSLAFRRPADVFSAEGRILSATSVPRSYCTKRLSSPPWPQTHPLRLRALPVSEPAGETIMATINRQELDQLE